MMTTRYNNISHLLVKELDNLFNISTELVSVNSI